MSKPLRRPSENDSGDPAYWMLARGLRDPSFRSSNTTTKVEVIGPTTITTTITIYKKGCYICEDPEFALMGLPLCQPCSKCVADGKGQGHVAADDSVCSECGHDQMDDQETSSC